MRVNFKVRINSEIEAKLHDLDSWKSVLVDLAEHLFFLVLPDLE